MNALLAWYFVAVWGAGYVATKIGLQYAPPFTFLSLRFSFGLLCLLPVVLFWRPRWPRHPAEWLHLAVAGLLMHAVQLGGSHYAQYLGMAMSAPRTSSPAHAGRCFSTRNARGTATLPSTSPSASIIFS